MSKLSIAQQQAEIKDSFTFLEKTCEHLPYKTFCYPYGGFHSFTGETENILSDEGCLFSFNVEKRYISKEDLLNRPQALPRFDCNDFPFGKIWERA